jgi:hypothetical protein
MVESMCQRGGVVTHNADRDSFNIDKLDGNGLSKVVLDPRNMVDSFQRIAQSFFCLPSTCRTVNERPFSHGVF